MMNKARFFERMAIIFALSYLVECRINSKTIFNRLIGVEDLLKTKFGITTSILASLEKKLDQPTCPVTCNPAVCQPGEMCINLDKTGATTGSIPGVSVMSAVTPLVNGRACSRQAVFKVHFLKDPAVDPCKPNLDAPLPQQRMLKVQMYFSNGERSRWLFNIADSKSNDGGGGDDAHHRNDAEVQGFEKDITVYGHDFCHVKELAKYANALDSPVSMANFMIRNKYLKITNDNGLYKANCSKCHFALSGQPDLEGPVNEDIFIGANRVIKSGDKTGYGLCYIKLRWVVGTLRKEA